MKSKKIYVQISNLKNLEQILNFLNWWKIDFETELEETIFNKSIYVLEKYLWWKIDFNWFVIWNEFCEHLSFNIDILKNLLSLIWDKELIINTSILTIYNEKYYKSLFNLLKENQQNFKLIINDIWFIKFVSQFWLINENIILWRLILKQKKIFNIKNKTQNIFDDQTINIDLFKYFFEKYNINSKSIDILPQWNYIENYKNTFLYLPWWYYASSRWCVTKSHYSKKNYIFPLRYCDRPCLWTYMELDNVSHLIWKWNSIFYKSIDFLKNNDISNYENIIFQAFFPI